MDWQLLFQNLGMFFIGSGFITWLLKQITRQSFVKELEKFKSDLLKEDIKFRIRYEKLHSERAEVIKKVYKKISRTYKAFYSYLSPIQSVGDLPEEVKRKQALDEFNSLSNYYEENRIFFEETTAKEIDNLLESFMETFYQFYYSKDKTDGTDRDVQKWNKAWKKLTGDTLKIKRLIENEFRNIIGVG